MKSIEEKAEEYGYTNWQSDEYHDGTSEGLEFDPIGHTQRTFEAGANYVLEEILDKTSKCTNIKDAYEVFLECVEQLKK